MTFVVPAASPALAARFAVIALALGGLLVFAVWWTGRHSGERPDRTRKVTLAAGVGVALWLATSAALALSGILLHFERRPPSFGVMVLVSAAVTVALAMSPLGGRLVRGLPLAALVGAQGFRLPLELLMHRALVEGVMPVQMSYEGYNFDILTGASALVVAALLARRRAPRWLVIAWNVGGLLLVVNVVTIAFVSTPGLAAFGPDRLNVWIATFPFVWLPEVMVMAALLGHVLVFRALRVR